MAGIQEAWLDGVSSPRVDEQAQATRLSGISKSTVSKLCQDIDERGRDFPDRPLAGRLALLWLDATSLRCARADRMARSPQ